MRTLFSNRALLSRTKKQIQAAPSAAGTIRGVAIRVREYRSPTLLNVNDICDFEEAKIKLVGRSLISENVSPRQFGIVLAEILKVAGRRSFPASSRNDSLLFYVARGRSMELAQSNRPSLPRQPLKGRSSCDHNDGSVQPSLPRSVSLFGLGSRLNLSLEHYPDRLHPSPLHLPLVQYRISSPIHWHLVFSFQRTVPYLIWPHCALASIVF